MIRPFLATWHESSMFSHGLSGMGEMNLIKSESTVVSMSHAYWLDVRYGDLSSRDPANPSGYLNHLYSVAAFNPVAKSDIEEGS